MKEKKNGKRRRHIGPDGVEQKEKKKNTNK
jgi:hypothetical protein